MSNETTEGTTDTPEPGMEPDLAAAVIQNQIQDPKSSIGLYDLPCGYLDSEGTLHREVKVREIRGDEEDMMANPKMSPNAKINALITQCVERVGTVVSKDKVAGAVQGMTVGDRLFTLFAVRRVTVGDEYTFEAKCPDCSAMGRFTVDLSELETKGMADPYKRSYEARLPSSGSVVVYHPMTGVEEAKLSQLDKKKTDSVSLSLAMRIDTIDGQKPTIQRIKSLSMKDRMYLRKEFDKVEGGVETEVELQCMTCSNEFKQDLDVGQASFFFPTEAQES